MIVNQMVATAPDQFPLSGVGVLPGHGAEVAQGVVYVGTRFVVGYQVGSLLYEGSVPVNITSGNWSARCVRYSQ